jgi:hypothetical protein
MKRKSLRCYAAFDTIIKAERVVGSRVGIPGWGADTWFDIWKRNNLRDQTESGEELDEL